MIDIINDMRVVGVLLMIIGASKIAIGLYLCLHKERTTR